MSLIPHLQTIAKGKGRGRALTFDEAKDAMTTILTQDVAPETLGAFLMVLRFRGEEPQEIAGFTAALCMQTAHLHGGFDLDWPCYAAGRTRGVPYFLLSAKLVAQAGYKVALHGWNSHQQGVADIRSALTALNIPVNAENASITYLPLEDLSGTALHLVRMRETLGLRSCINTVLRMWNPTNAPAMVQGVFHPSYRGLQTLAAETLGRKMLTVIKGGGGEFERNPTKQTDIFGLRAGVALREVAPPLLEERRKLTAETATVAPIALWNDARDDFAESVVIGTAALALWTLNDRTTLQAATRQARALWDKRHTTERNCA